MNRKTFGVLAVVTAVLVVLAFLSQRGGDTGPIAGESVGEPLLPALAATLGSIVEVTVEGAGSERLVSLERDGDTWVVAELGGYPAEARQVNALLIALAEAAIVEEKTGNPAFHSRLGVEAVDSPEATGLEVALVAAGGERYEVVLGDSYGSNQRYSRRAGEDLSYLVDRNPEVARSPSDWVEPAIVSIAPARIQQVAVTHADGEQVVIRKESRDATNFIVDDIPEGRELEYAGIANVTGNVLQNLRLDDVRRQPDEPGEPAVTSAFSTFDGLVITVSAHEAEDGEPWLSFQADFDAEQALAWATEPDATAVGSDAAGPDAMAEAEALAGRLSGWQYRIPSYQFSQMTRRMDDLLRAPAED